ncbi:ABC transporter permease [Anaerobacillus sp. CMMVII]|uniref:ABC transporter permease n=1 Tax=Anaerobacillus sp. CMMVII TaxID=2755588 RepID=UPI0021B786F0|nr:ABC transporter permease [Anaerobacillus sp. CMMVII]
MKHENILSAWYLGYVCHPHYVITNYRTFYKVYLDDPGPGGWQEGVIAKNAQYQMIIAEGGMPGMALEHYQREIILNEYRLEHDIPPVETKSFWGFMTSSVNLISIVTMFTIIVAAGIVAGEFTWGTIKLLLIRPASRSKILLSKYLATFVFAILMLLGLFIFSIGIGALLFGASTLTQPHLFFEAGTVVERNMFSHILMLYSLSSVELLMMVTFAFMISTIFRSSSLAIGLALFLMFTGSQLVHVLSQYEWVKYILFANTYLVQYIEGTPIVEGMTMTFSLVMLAIYFIIFNLLSWVIFQKRDVAA